MKTRILLAGLALFAFTTIGVAQETAKKAEVPAKTGCGAECGKAKEGEKKTCCNAAKTDKAPAAKTTKTAPAKTQPKK